MKKFANGDKFEKQASLNLTQRHLQEFRQDINDLRLALQVHSALRGSVDPANVRSACITVAKREGLYKKISDKRLERLPNERHVSKAYGRWFFEPGCIALTPFPTEPLKPRK